MRARITSSASPKREDSGCCIILIIEPRNMLSIIGRWNPETASSFNICKDINVTFSSIFFSIKFWSTPMIFSYYTRSEEWILVNLTVSYMQLRATSQSIMFGWGMFKIVAIIYWNTSDSKSHGGCMCTNLPSAKITTIANSEVASSLKSNSDNLLKRSPM